MKTKNYKNSWKTYLLILLIGIGMGIFVILGLTKEREEPKITKTTIQEQLQKSAELTTTKYFYTKVGKFENSLDLNGWSIPLTKKFFILSFDGEADLGIDLNQIDIQVKKDIIKIHLPNVRILSNSIDEKSIEVYDESKNIFNPISVSDYKKFAISQKDAIEKEIQEKNVYKEAEKNTLHTIEDILNSVPEIQKNYKIDISF